MAVAMLYRDELKEYDFGSGHPFRGDRYENFMSLLRSHRELSNRYEILKAEKAVDEDLLKICDPDYIEFCTHYYQATYAGWSYFYENLDRYQSRDNRPLGMPGKIEEAARLIVGQAKLGCDLIQRENYRKVISIGGGLHHAKRRFGEGFCIYNDVAFAATYLIERYKLERVVIVDTDAHAANGTAEYFSAEPRVLLVDIHQDPHTIYPGTGLVSDVGMGRGKGFTLNIPLPVFAGDESYQLVLEQLAFPVIQEFRPQIIIRNGGSDPHFNDGLTNLGLSMNGFRMMGDKIREMAEICGGKHLDLIASGYTREILPFAWLSLLCGIADFPAKIQEPGFVPVRLMQENVVEETRKVIQAVRECQRPFWKCFR